MQQFVQFGPGSDERSLHTGIDPANPWAALSKIRLLYTTLLLAVLTGALAARAHGDEEQDDRPPVDESELTRLVRLLTAGDADTAGEALSQLNELGKATSPVAHQLIPLLSNTDRRLIAIRIVDERGAAGRVDARVADHIEWLLERQGELAVPSLLTGLVDANADVRGRCATVLGKIKAHSAIPQLLERLSDGDATVQGRASSALTQMGEAAVAPLIRTMLQGIRDVHGTVPPQVTDDDVLRVRRERAAGALGGIKDLRAMEPLLTAMETEGEPGLRRWAAYSLNQLAMRMKNAHKPPPENFSDADFISRLLNLLPADDEQVRSCLSIMLALVPKQSRQPLLSALDSDDRMVRLVILRAWFSIGREDDRVVPALLRRISDVPEEDSPNAVQERSLALRILANHLAQLQPSEILPVILARFHDRAADVRYSASYALQRAPEPWLKDHRIVPVLLDVLADHTDWQTRVGVIQALGECRDSAAVEPLLAVLKSEKPFSANGAQDRADLNAAVIARNDRSIRSQICSALAKIGDDKALPTLRERLELNEPFVIETIGKLGDRASVPEMVRRLDSESEEVWLAAVEALSVTPDEAAVEPLIRLFNRVVSSDINRDGFRAGRSQEAGIRAIAKALAATGSEHAAAAIVASLRHWKPRLHFDEESENNDTIRPAFDPRARAIADFKEIAMPAILAELNAPLDVSTPWSRQVCTWAIGQDVFSRHPIALPAHSVTDALIRMLKEGEIRTKIQAAETIGSLKIEEAVPELFRQLQRADVISRDDATEATAAPEDVEDLQMAILQALSWSDSVRGHKLLEAKLRSPFERVRYAAVFAMVSAKHPQATEHLIPMLLDSSTTVRWAAARQLGFAGDGKAVTPLLRLLKEADQDTQPVPTRSERNRHRQPYYPAHTSSDVIAAAVQSLGMLGNARVADSIFDVAHSSDTDIRCSAAMALSQLGDERGVKLLRDIFNTNDSRLHEKAMIQASHLAMFAEQGWGAKLSFPPLRSVLREQAEGGTARARIYGPGALRGHSDEDTINTLLRIIETSDDYIRVYAVQFLLTTEYERRFEVLSVLLTDPSPRCRIAAIQQYAKAFSNPASQLKSADTVKAVIRCLSDSDASVREAALRALLVANESAELSREINTATLNRLATADAAPGVRHLALRLLEDR